MKQLSGLKPCPLCGSTPFVSDISSEYKVMGGMTAMLCEARIRCRCGLIFEKKWIESPTNPALSDADIIEVWNDLIEKRERGDE